MILKQKLMELLEKLTGSHMYYVLPRGIDRMYDIAKSFPQYRVEIVFDIGANVGQSSETYLAGFPHSKIYCFEPVSKTFVLLQEKLKGNERVNYYQLAFGSSKRKGIMSLQGSSDLSFLLEQAKESSIKDDLLTESVEVVTLDDFCTTKKIDRINYLKIDTEGGDLEVLKGGAAMLAEQKIDMVEVETGMNPGNKRHVPFEVLKKYLESYNYFLFGIYEQMNEWPTREPHLRRTNPIFISRRMIEKRK